MPEGYSQEELRPRIRWYINLRWFIIIGLGTTGIVPQLLQEGYSTQVLQNILVVLTVALVNGLFWLINNISGPRYLIYKSLAISQLVFDLVVMSAVIYFNAGIETANVMLYVIPIIMAGVLLGRKAVYITGISAAIIYDWILVADYQGIIKTQHVLAPQLHTHTDYLIQTLFFIPAVLITISVIADFVAKFILERTQLSASLQVVSAEKAQIDAILKTLGSALIVINTKGTVTLVNDAFDILTGWSKDEVIGRELDKVLPLLDENGRKVAVQGRPMLKALEPKTQFGNKDIIHVSSYYYAKKDGTIFPFVGAIAPIVVGGKIMGATTVFDDATSTKQIQQLKSNFVALAAHQLKTPLGEINGYADIMLGGITGKLNDKQTEYLKQIQEIALRSTKMIGSLLDISVLEQGSMRFNIQDISLSETIVNVIKIHQNRIRQKNITITIKELDKNIVVRADKDKLIEIIGNVVDNAISHSVNGESVIIETKTSNTFGFVLVKDQGEGIDPGIINEIFKKKSLLSSVPTSTSGTGLGLYLAKQLLELQHGNINVLSSSKRGTTLEIKIPLGGKNRGSR